MGEGVDDPFHLRVAVFQLDVVGFELPDRIGEALRPLVHQLLETFSVGDPPEPLSSVKSMAPPETGAGATMLADVNALADVLREKGVM